MCRVKADKDKMKYFIVFALIATVASAAVRPTPVSAEMAEIQEIIAAIQSPSTDPATAAALEDMLLDILGLKPIVGPAIIPVEGISIGPAIIPFPLPDGGAVVEEPIAVAPVVEAPAPVPSVPSAPLVQIIVNVNAQAAGASPVEVSPVEVNPVDIVAPEVIPDPAHIEGSENWPILAPGHVEINPVDVVEVAPEPVQVVEVAPVPVEPVQIGVPVLPEAAVILPEQLN
ncbi:hypothetical protein PYW07_005947 [Mythimna separata]|uniref:Uncharacterized protein n=1 Tax=Mythimna separata TaxID=271217 RepID=A0AAD7YJ92_MYTSE|nr:hypothetical protein PYW07_005947 [Mythimna separata]